jgi:tetratricopeptide (TPR) repeat protein
MSKANRGNRVKRNEHFFLKPPNRSVTPIGEESAITNDLLKRALQYHRAGHLVEAQQIYRDILTVDPNHEDSLHLLGMMAFHAGDPQKAIVMVQAAIAINPTTAAYHSNLGTIFHSQNKLEEAACCYQNALALKPDLAEAHYNLGNVFHAQDKLEDAIACYEQALALNPGLAEAHYNLGNTLRSQEKFDEAIGCFKRSLAIDHGKYEALHNWGNVLQAQGKLEEAMVFYERVLHVHPVTPRLTIAWVARCRRLANLLKRSTVIAELGLCSRTLPRQLSASLWFNCFKANTPRAGRTLIGDGEPRTTTRRCATTCNRFGGAPSSHRGRC